MNSSRVVGGRLHTRLGASERHASVGRLTTFVLALAGLLAVAGGARAQEGDATVRVEVSSERGVVVDADVRADTVTRLTNSDGRVLIHLPPGTYRLTVSMIGYRTVNYPIALAAGVDTTLAIELEETAIEAEELRVSVTRTGKIVEDEPIRVEAVPREEIEENLTSAPGNVTTLLTEMSGVRMQTTAPSIGGGGLRLEGLRGRYTEILSDGLPIYGAEPGALELFQIPPLDLARVEVIKGPASAMYGPSALGGVLNLVPRRSGGPAELVLSHTSHNGTDASLFTSGAVGRGCAYTVLASGSRQSLADLDNDGWADLAGYSRGVLRPRLFCEGKGGRSLSLTIGGMAENRSGGTLMGRKAPSGTPFLVRLDSRRLDAGLVAERPIGAKAFLRVRTSATNQWRRRVFGPDRDRERRHVLYGEVTIQGSAWRNDWMVGAALREDLFRSREFPVFDFTYTSPALLIQDEFSPTAALSLAASARVDDHSLAGTFLSPRFSVLVRPGSGWTFRGAAGLGFAAPVPLLEEVQETGLSRLRPLSDSLRAERVRGGSIDLGRSAGSLELHATLFGSAIEDALLLDESAQGERPLTIVNALTPTRTWGTELLARYRQGPLQIIATHTFLHSTEASPAGIGRRSSKLTPNNEIGLDGIWEEEDRGRAGVEFTYVGRQPLEDDPYRVRSRPYVLMNVLAEIRIGSQRLFLNIADLTDVRQTKFGAFLLNVRGPDGRWTTDAWAPLEGRTLNAGVWLTF